MKTVLITGANRGLGLEFCRKYLALGYYVHACCRDLTNASNLQSLQCERLGFHQLDVGSDESLERLAVELGQENVTIDLLINNAGICEEQRFGIWSRDKFIDNLNVNAVGPALVTQAVYPFLTESSKVVFISSGLGSIAENINPDGPFEGYSMSKACLSVLCQRMSSSTLAKKIQFACVSPGWVKTDMGGEEAPLSARESVQGMVSVIDQLNFETSGSFFKYDGTTIAW